MTGTPNRPPLSPAAQAVLDAVASSMEGGLIFSEFVPYEARKIAAALRAAALYCTRERRILMAIADELEGQQSTSSTH